MAKLVILQLEKVQNHQRHYNKPQLKHRNLILGKKAAGGTKSLGLEIIEGIND